MARQHSTRNDSGDFLLTINDDGTWTHDLIHVALLADIRRELRKLNTLLHCPNFTDIPHILREIRRNTAKPKRRKVKKP